MSNKFLFGSVAIIIVIFGVLYATSKHAPMPKAAPVVANLNSLSTSATPWPFESQHLADRLKAIHLSLLSSEGSAQHIHAHLDIYIHGKQVVVPADIGIPSTGGITSVHTHDTSGIIHVESPDATATYTLGQFFDIWGVRLTNTSIGGYANNTTDKLTVYANGKDVPDPINQPIQKHEEIVVVYGTNTETPSIPKNFSFPSGL